ncbi:MAG: hypothetical protein ACPGWM_04835 [Flavobacteriales bacterium]
MIKFFGKSANACYLKANSGSTSSNTNGEVILRMVGIALFKKYKTKEKPHSIGLQVKLLLITFMAVLVFFGLVHETVVKRS